MKIPVSTYRLQFNRDFRFSDALRIVDYLHDLGITDLYASPILKARPGSSHGYDVTDPSQLNPEIGTAQEFNELCRSLHSRGMGRSHHPAFRISTAERNSGISVSPTPTIAGPLIFSLASQCWMI